MSHFLYLSARRREIKKRLASSFKLGKVVFCLHGSLTRPSKDESTLNFLPCIPRTYLLARRPWKSQGPETNTRCPGCQRCFVRSFGTHSTARNLITEGRTRFGHDVNDLGTYGRRCLSSCMNLSREAYFANGKSRPTFTCTCLKIARFAAVKR